MYQQGKSFKEIARVSGVGPIRVGQIIRAEIPDVVKERNALRKAKDREMTAAELDRPVKDALREYCSDRSIPMSRFISELVERELKALGIDLSRYGKKAYKGEPLPFTEDNS